MKPFFKSLLINLIILLLYSLAIGLYSVDEYEGEMVLFIFTFIAVAVHFGILFILTVFNFVKGNSSKGRLFLSNLVMVLFFAAIVTPLMLAIFH